MFRTGVFFSRCQEDTRSWAIETTKSFTDIMVTMIATNLFASFLSSVSAYPFRTHPPKKTTTCNMNHSLPCFVRLLLFVSINDSTIPREGMLSRIISRQPHRRGFVWPHPEKYFNAIRSRPISPATTDPSASDRDISCSRDLAHIPSAVPRQNVYGDSPAAHNTRRSWRSPRPDARRKTHKSSPPPLSSHHHHHPPPLPPPLAAVQYSPRYLPVPRHSSARL